MFDMLCYHCKNLNLAEWKEISIYCNICFKKENQDKSCIEAAVECSDCEYFMETSYFEKHREECLKKMRKKVSSIKKSS